jgi:hypothetical protein
MWADGEEIGKQIIPGGGSDGFSEDYGLSSTAGLQAAQSGSSENYTLNHGFWFPGVSGQTGACCLNDFSCLLTSDLECISMGGTYLGDGTDCGEVVACCLPDGSCQEMSANCCLEMGGTVSISATCLGDNDGSGIDDGCELEYVLKWEQLPDTTANNLYLPNTYGGLYTPEQIGLNANEWICTESGDIRKIEIWGFLSGDDISSFQMRLGIYSNVTADQNQYGNYDMPGDLLWSGNFGYEYELVAESLSTAYYYPEYDITGPYTGNLYLITIYLDEGEFTQQGTLAEPVTYWLATQAFVGSMVAGLGWISSSEQENASATYITADLMPIPSGREWFLLDYPSGHAFDGQPLDLAFRIYGVGIDDFCQGICGDANNDNSLNVSDAVFIAKYIFSGGGEPLPVKACGDVNADGKVNVSDG